MIAVLLVDDDPSLFNITRILLEKEGEITVDLCNSGYEALEILKTNPTMPLSRITGCRK